MPLKAGWRSIIIWWKILFVSLPSEAKNYLFAGSHDAARRAAMIYSLLGTCKLKKVEPFSWINNVFEVLPDWKYNRLTELLP